MAVGDLDNDRDLDFVIGGQWLQNSPLTAQDDVRDDFVNEVCTAVYRGSTERRFDRNGDGTVSRDDVTHVIRDVLGTTIADVNLDRRFDSRDLVLLFQAGQYDDGVTGNSTWSTGDFNCDGEFDSSDLVVAFQAGAYVP
jgi:hypothetical protein